MKKYDKEFYQKNKEKFKQYTYKWRNENRDKENMARRKWKKENKERLRETKKADNKKYYEKRKLDASFKLHRKLYAQEYNSRPEVKENTKKVRQKYMKNPEIKAHRAAYNKKFHQENPDKLLKNTRKHLQKIGAFHKLKWYQMSDQLRGWSEIIHKDCDETCQICFAPSQQAHHILHKTKYPELAFNRNNGIALCTKCHNETHGKMLTTNTILS